MEIQKIFTDGEERLYSVLLDKAEVRVFSILGKIKAATGHLKRFISGFLHKGHHNVKEVVKSFSNIDTKELLKTSEKIPEYKILIDLREFTFIYWGIRNHNDYMKFNETSLAKHFPIFTMVLMPPAVATYRAECIKQKKGDWAEICFLMDGEIDFVYDFDRQMWSLRDYSMKPGMEYEIKNGHLRGIIEFLVDPEKNELLKRRLEILKKDDPESYQDLIIYLKQIKKGIF